MATGQSFDIVVVGAGPAGLAAAIEAAKRGARTLVVDENNKPGGQLFKQIHKFFGSHEHRAGVRGYDIGRQLLDEAANERSIREINEAIRRSANGTRKV